MNNKQGITLAEVLIATAIMLMIMSAGFSLLQSGSKAAGKGGSHLANSIAAANLARRLEMDIQSAEKVEIVSQGRQGEIRISFSRPAEGGALESVEVQYLWPAGDKKGLIRRIADAESTTFCADRYVAVLELARHEFGPSIARHGYQINLSVASRNQETVANDAQNELVNVKRFAYAHNGNLAAISPVFNDWASERP